MAKSKRNRFERKKQARAREKKLAHAREIKRLKKIAKKEHKENIENNNIVLNKIPEVVIYSDDIVKTTTHNNGILNVQCPNVNNDNQAGSDDIQDGPRDPSTPLHRGRNVNSLPQNNESAAKKRLRLVGNNNVSAGVSDDVKPSKHRVVNMDMLAQALGSFLCVMYHAKLEIQVSYLTLLHLQISLTIF